MNDFDTLVCLADKLYSRFDAQGNPSDLSLCIVHYRSALTLAKSSTTVSSDAQSKLFSNLANVLSIRFRRHGDLADLDHSVECHLTALNLRPPGHPGRAKTLSNLATVLLVRFGQLGMQQDIEQAIEHFNTALSMLSADGRLMPLMNYASALFSRFLRYGGVSDLNDAICQYRAVVDASPAENISTSYYNLANALLSRFKLENDPKDLQLTIEYSSVALDGMSTSHPDCIFALSCLSSALIRRFELYEDVEDLETAVKNFKSALDLRSQAEEASQHVAFFDLADALVMRYKLRSDLPDLELAIKHYRTALDLLVSDHKKGRVLDNLGNALFLRFSRSGSLDDLDEAAQKYSLALEVHSEDLSTPRSIATLGALGTCLSIRFDQLGDQDDLHTAISLYIEALTEALQDHPHRAAILLKCASGLERRFRYYGGIVDLDRSISCCREALELLPLDHPDRATAYQTLASSLLLRFVETGDEFDIDEAFLSCNTCMDMQCTSDSLRATCHLLLARISKARVLPWEVKDIDSIFHHLRVAKDLCTLTSPLISDVYAELASAYYLRFLRESKSCDLHEALGLHELSMNVGSGSLWPAFRASLQWTRDAETYGHRSGIDAYRSALHLVDRLVLTLRSPELRQCLARRFCPSLAYGGASFALRFQSWAEAIEAIEDGRSVLWSLLVRAKTCLDELRLTGDHGVSLAEDFECLALQLEGASSVSECSMDVKPLLKEKEAVVTQIRNVEGFNSFLQVTPFSDLEKAAADGPIVILNAGQYTCDALVLLYNMLPIHVPLSRATLRDILRMAARFRELTSLAGGGDEKALKHLLSDLWDLVVSPVVQQISPYIPRGSRLWWCPTGIFTSIPLHAAAPYRHHTPKTRFSQPYVFSYTPTLQALIRARAATPPRGTSRPRRAGSLIPGLLKRKKSKPSMTTAGPPAPAIVAIGHGMSDETCQALDLLRNRVPPRVPFRRVEGDEVRIEAVRAAFGAPVWLHLACPASLDTRRPCRSGFAMRDGTLTVRDIAGACPRAEFAFLSGRCSTVDTRGKDAGLEEVMHLAASLQYAGVRSVIGTLWPVDEEVMQQVTAAFYEDVVLKAGASMHYTSAAQSLSEALKAVGKGIPFAQKIAFVHVGA